MLEIRVLEGEGVGVKGVRGRGCKRERVFEVRVLEIRV